MYCKNTFLNGGRKITFYYFTYLFFLFCSVSIFSLTLFLNQLQNCQGVCSICFYKTLWSYITSFLSTSLNQFQSFIIINPFFALFRLCHLILSCFIFFLSQIILNHPFHFHLLLSLQIIILILVIIHTILITTAISFNVFIFLFTWCFVTFMNAQAAVNYSVLLALFVFIICRSFTRLELLILLFMFFFVSWSVYIY